MTPSTMVQADRQGPSITTCSPELRNDARFSRYGPIWPPGSLVMRMVAEAGEEGGKIASAIMAVTVKAVKTCMFHPFEPSQRPLFLVDRQGSMKSFIN